MQLEKQGEIGTVIEFQGEDVLVVVKNEIRRWGTEFVTVRPCSDKSGSEETNRILSNMCDHLEVLAEELQQISERIG
jgi:hypothetical protein